MVDVDMNPTPSKVIGREDGLRIKGPSRLLKDLGLKKHPTLKGRKIQRK
jgi:hypothetical protein